MNARDVAKLAGTIMPAVSSAIERKHLPATRKQKMYGKHKRMVWYIKPADARAWAEFYAKNKHLYQRNILTRSRDERCIVDGTACITDGSCSGCGKLQHQETTTMRASAHSPSEATYGKRQATGISGVAHNGR